MGQSRRNTNTQVKNRTEYSCARSPQHLTLVPGFSACVMLWYAVVSDVTGLRDVSRACKERSIKVVRRFVNRQIVNHI